jgi:hypothetical protein
MGIDAPASKVPRRQAVGGFVRYSRLVDHGVSPAVPKGRRAFFVVRDVINRIICAKCFSRRGWYADLSKS